MAAIETVELTKRYGAVVAVDDLSFSVREGAVTGFLGPNGAGKTTTLRMILALARPTPGHATVLGQPYVKLDAAGAHGRREPRGGGRAPRPQGAATTCARWRRWPASRARASTRC